MNVLQNLSSDSPMSSAARLPSSPPPSRMTDRPDIDRAIESPTPSQDRAFSPSLSEPSPLAHECKESETSRIKKSKKRRLFRIKDRPLLRKLAKYNPTLTLENSGSVARDHLASERTFLAYVRTSLTITSTGVALVQLFTISAATENKAIQKYSRPLGATIVIVGMFTIMFGMIRYFTIQIALIRGNFPVARVSSALLAGVLAAIIIVVFGILLGVRGNS